MLINMILLVDITKIFIFCHKYNNIADNCTYKYKFSL